MKIRNLFSLVVVAIILSAVVFALADKIDQPASSPTATGYTLTDIYNLIKHNQTAGTHTLSPTAPPTTPSAYSVSELYADLANLVKRETVATDTAYLGVTGSYGNPDPAYATTSVIASTLTPFGTPGDATGYSLEDIYQLIMTNATTTAQAHAATPVSTPADSLHSLSDIYTALTDLGTSKSTLVASGTTYLGVVGSYVPIVTGICPSGMTGSGNLNDPCLVINCTQLAAIDANLTFDYTLTISIDCSDTYPSGFPQIGSSGSQFTGTLDGKGYDVTGLSFSYQYFSVSGFVRYLGSSGVIKNIHLHGSTAQGSTDYVGTLAGFNYGLIQNSSAIFGSVSVGGTGGGLVAVNSGTIDGSFASTSISGNHKGGLVGNNAGTISNSYAIATVSGSGAAGGIAHANSGTISNSYAIATVMSSGDNAAGGITGVNYSGGSVENNFFVGTVFHADQPYGAIVGRSDTGASITNSYYNDVGSPSVCVGSDSGTTTNCVAIPNNQSYFYNNNNLPLSTWDFGGIWQENIGAYPTLKWQN